LSAAGLASPSLLCGAKAENNIPNLISHGTYGLPGYSLEDAIQLVAEMGFDSIEIAAMAGYHGAPDQVSKAQRGEVRSLLNDSNVKLGALMGLPIPSAAKQTDNSAWIEQMLELANDLSPDEAPLIQGVLGGGKWEDKKALFRDCLGPWVELASKAGVKLAIKPHRGNATSLPDHAIWLIEQLDAAGTLTMVYDHSHFAFRDLPVRETVAKALPHTGYLVMKDAVQREGKVKFDLPGTYATIPHAAILKQFIEGGYRGEICSEVSSHVWKAEGYDAKEATKTCFVNLHRITDQASEKGFTSIFNGSDLNGWDSKPGAWEVRDGEIWCTGADKNKNWLIWREQQPADFVFRLEFRWDNGNSGVQVRSDDLGEWQVFGYQAEVASQEKMGLWHHSLLDRDHPKREARHLMATAGQVATIVPDGSKTVKQVMDPAEVQAHFREHEWNTMEIIARGPEVIHNVNGVMFATVIDQDEEMSRSKGFVALQDHGKGCVVAFRNLRLKRL
ncbi:MAG: family 16 glycoside hydrolase, partial [Verrucomicrobiota bacterium]